MKFLKEVVSSAVKVAQNNPKSLMSTAYGTIGVSLFFAAVNAQTQSTLPTTKLPEAKGPTLS